MKSAKMWLGLLAACGVAAMAASAKSVRRGTETAGGVAWSYTIIGETASVTGAEPAVGVLEIPSSLGGLPVTAVGYRAFSSCEDLTGVEIPMGVAEVESRAFQYCPALASVTIPDGVTNIGAMAFQYCGSLETVVLPQTVENIGTNAFYYCDALTKLYVPVLWTGTSKVRNAGVGSGCTVVYGEPGKETLKFDANGGNCETLFQFYPLDEAYGWLPEATREDHFEFAGWWTAAGGGGTRVMESDMASAEGLRTLYAHWTPVEQVVSFNANGGSCGTTTCTFAIGNTYASLPMAMREGYAFDGWFTASSGGERVLQDATVTEVATRTLYAHWTLVEQTVTFNANGGSCSTASRVYVIGGTYSPLPTAALEGYDFDGWFATSAGGARVTKDSTVTEAVSRTLYAHWTLSEQVVAFDANGGVCDTASRTYTIGNAYGWLPEAEREGYSFDGWFDSSGSRIDKTSKVTVMRQRTLQARWSLLEQVVTFDANGGACDTATHAYAVGAAYGWLPEAEREGYSFDGWYDFSGRRIDTESQVTGERTATLLAHWTVCEQIVSFDANGGECDISIRTYMVGEAYGWLPEAEREGYSFDGWYDFSGRRIDTESQVPEERTATLQAHWTVCEQIVSFDANGGECDISIRTYMVGEAYGWLPEAYLKGYRLEGWFDASGSRIDMASQVTTNRERTLKALWTKQEERETVDGVTWSYYVYRNEAFITGATPGEGAVTIPDALGGYSVTDFDPSVFARKENLTSVTIPDGVRTVGRWAFAGCENLAKVTIGQGVTSIGWGAFSDCSYDLFDTTSMPGLRLVDGWVVGYTDSIPAEMDLSGLRGIVDGAFECCGTLTAVTLPEGMKNIGDSTFNECSKLNTVSLGQNVTNIGASAFYYCTNLESVTIPNSVKSISPGAFGGCSSLKEVQVAADHPVYAMEDGVLFTKDRTSLVLCPAGTPLGAYSIPDNVAAIEDFAFDGCVGLTAVTIGANVTHLGVYAFSGCTGLVSATILGNIADSYGEDGYPFTGCRNLRKVTLGGCLTQVPDYTFFCCHALESIEFGENITRIGIDAFAECGLVTLRIPDGVTEIDHYAFSGCQKLCTGSNSLTTVWLPASVTNIGYNAFNNCSGLATMYVPEAWRGTSMLSKANVTSSCRISYYSSPTTKQTVAFDATGGNCDTATQTYSIGETYSPLPTATRENWTFDGWFTEAERGEQVSDSTTVTEEANRTLYAHWTLVKQVVAFDATDGNCETATRTYTIGDAYSPLPTATRENWGFDGWFTEAEGGEQVSDSTTVTEEATRTLYAHWTLVKQVVAFDATGGECETATHVYAIGDTYSSLPTATRENWGFDGWFTEAEGGEQVSDSTTVTEAATLTLYAHWTRIKQVVAFDANDGECETATRAYAIGETYSPLPTATRENWGFDGWFTEAEGGERVSDSTTVTEAENRTLYAHWRPTRQTVAFDANGGTCNPSRYVYTIGAPYGWLPEAEKDGFSFAGWFDAAGNRVEASSEVTDERTRSLWAQWITHGEVVDGVSWTFVVRRNEAFITHATPLEGAVTIPETLDGHPVVGFSETVFFRQTALTSISIPTSITNIESGAFLGCVGLTEFKVEANHPAFAVEDGILFSKDRKTLVCCPAGNPLGAYVVPESVTDIGKGAFSGCGGLTSVAIGTNVTSIGDLAFSDCVALEAAMVFGNITNTYAENMNPFANCLNLRQVSLGGAMTSVPSYIFYACNALCDVEIGDGVVVIGRGAFHGCSHLSEVVIDGNVAAIEAYAFYNCSSLVAVPIPDSVTSIGAYAFHGCRSLTSMAIPDNVTSIGNWAFRWCSGLTSVTIGDSVTSIGASAFQECNGLTSVTIGNSVTNIGASAFYDCYRLKSVTIPDSVTSIGDCAFYDCSGLTSMTIPDSVTSIGDYAFYNCSRLTSVTISDSVTSIGASAFEYCSGLTSMTIPDSVTSIGYGVFRNCNNLQTLYAPVAWKGTDRLGKAQVPSECTIIYVTPYLAQTVTFAVSIGSCGTGIRAYAVGLAYGWLPEATRPGFIFAGWWTAEEGGTQVTEGSLVEEETPRTLYAHWTLANPDYAVWVEEQGMAEGDFPPDGDADGDGTTNWEEYVAGTNPLDAEERLEVRMEWGAGTLKIEPSVSLPSGRSIRVKGKRTLDDEEEWTDLTGEESTWMEDGWRFFRVGVELAE